MRLVWEPHSEVAALTGGSAVQPDRHDAAALMTDQQLVIEQVFTQTGNELPRLFLVEQLVAILDWDMENSVLPPVWPAPRMKRAV